MTDWAAHPQGHTFTGYPGRDLPDKIPGKHRWVTLVMHTTTADALKAASRGDQQLLDQETLISIMAGCYDCEHEWPAPEPCTAGDTWTREG
jgi:hypothetical protein